MSINTTWCLSKSGAPTQSASWQGLRVAAVALACAAVFFAVVLLAYEMAVARVPQHRAALERLVRAQTGLDVHFDELDLRWGWYGPEAVFRRVELGEPGRTTVLLRAPELVVAFDLWQTLRGGQLAASRITLVAADVDLARTTASGLGHAPGGAGHAVGAAPVADGVRILEGWQGGRLDLEGGTLRLPDPAGSNNPVVLQIRRASLRRSPASEWSGYGLVFLPERLGHSARLVVRLDGNLERSADLSGTLRFEGHRLAFAGWRELLGAVPDAQRYLPGAGGGDVTLSLDFAAGRIAKASGQVSAGGLEFVTPDEPARTVFNLDHLRGEWQFAQGRGSDWHLQARLADVSIAPADHGFTLSGLSGEISSQGGSLIAALKTHSARLELAQAPQYPLDDVHVEARLVVNRLEDGWRIATEKLELQHQAAVLRIDGSLTGGESSAAPEINAHAELSGADVPLLERLAGASLPKTFGGTFSQLTGGRIERAELQMRGPLDETLAESGFSGSLLLRDAVLSGGNFWPDTRDIDARIDWRGSHMRMTATLNGARFEAVAGMPPMESLRGTLVFDSGDLRRTTLTGTWLGGPVTLTVGERRDHGSPVLSIQGRGMLDARHLALAATAGTVIDQSLAPTGTAPWSGELTYLAADEARPAQWHVKADSSLVGITSHLPEPLAKATAAAVPLHVDVQGGAEAAELRLRLGDRLHSLLSLRRRDATSWQVERGAVRFGTRPAVLPTAPVVLVDGRLNQLDLPAYVAAWQQLRNEPAAPAIRADLQAGEMLVAGRGYPEVHVVAERTDVGANLELHSADIAGTAYWPAVNRSSRPAQFHFTRLNVPDGSAFTASAELIAALGPATEFSVEDLVWEGHSLGSLSATIASGGNAVDVTDLHLTDSTQDLDGSMHCQSAACRLKFILESRNGAATLEDFGFRPELTAAKATLDGDLQWQVVEDRPPLATLAGRLNMHLEDGVTRADPDPHPQGVPFPLLLVPALVNGMGHPMSEPHALHFARLDGDFEFASGEAVTSNLHFDGDAEILMRGKTGLLARDYDQQVWILKGEGRLPAAVRSLDPTPRVAAAWLSLRDLFGGGGTEASARAPFHLQGSWDAPIVVAAE